MAERLTAFWVSFPLNYDFPLGFGVTAWSEQDALELLEERGFDYHRRAKKVDVRAGVTVDELDRHVRPNMGPIVVRGVWYPCFNIGFGTPPVR
jgi:hypothetical protein